MADSQPALDALVGIRGEVDSQPELMQRHDFVAGSLVWGGVGCGFSESRHIFGFALIAAVLFRTSAGGVKGEGEGCFAGKAICRPAQMCFG